MNTLDPGAFPPWQLAALVLAVAFLYSSVGFGGASGYLAAMSLFALSVNFMASTALVLNVLVASIAFAAYLRAGHFQMRLLAPFLLGSLPASFLGGYIHVEDAVYRTLLYLALTYLGIRLLMGNGLPVEGKRAPARPSWAWMLIGGAGIGLLSGILGLGGGIFLSPLIVLAEWGTPKQAAASSAGFIVVNSVSALLGRMVGGNFVFGAMGAALLPVGLVGALAGSRLGARRLSGPALRRLLGVILLLAAGRFFVVQIMG
ncbi:MAG: sulfite exporter TauE/SafE family protein [Caldilineae bacterium]|nr:MAG: sulfite exporter TauE/SafE family protein [Caldilineae bacterium]